VQGAFLVTEVIGFLVPPPALQFVEKVEKAISELKTAKAKIAVGHSDSCRRWRQDRSSPLLGALNQVASTLK
jgi:hypothetical protein